MTHVADVNTQLVFPGCPTAKLRPHKCVWPRKLRRVEQYVAATNQEFNIFVDRVEGVCCSPIGIRLRPKCCDRSETG